MNTSLEKQIEKVVVNVGIGRLMAQPGADKLLPDIEREFSLIAGQKPSHRTAKKSIAGFKLREGSVVGLKATLRGARMRAFLERLIKIVFPRVRDFRGIDKKNIDTEGNLNIGIKEQMVFSEINPETSKTNFGLQITVVPRRAKDRESAVTFYRELGIPFKK